MKKTFMLAAAVAIVLPSCYRPMPPVPSSGREVVPPQGSTYVEKAWGGVTPQEGSALLGPLATPHR